MLDGAGVLEDPNAAPAYKDVVVRDVVAAKNEAKAWVEPTSKHNKHVRIRIRISGSIDCETIPTGRNESVCLCLRDLDQISLLLCLLLLGFLLTVTERQ